MYRLLYLSCTPLRKNSGVSLNIVRNSCNCLTTDKTYYLYTTYFPNIQIRAQSTITSFSAWPKKERKKRMKSEKKYAELLVVSENSSVQEKARVQKLTSKDLKLLATTNLNLSELYKLKDNKFIEEHTYNNLAVIENLPSSNVDGEVELSKDLSKEQTQTKNVITPAKYINFCDIMIEDATFVADLAANAAEDDLDLRACIKPTNSFQPEELEDHHPIEVEVVKKVQTSEKGPKNALDERHRAEIAAKTLAAFIEVCNVLKTPQRGFNALQFHRGRYNRVKKQSLPLKDINVYNALLRGFAARGNFDKILDVLRMIKEEKVGMNVQSYARVFECLGRINIQDNHLRDIRVLAKEALSNGITFDKIMNEATFLYNEREIVLSAIKACNPSYVPTYYEPKLQYTNHLVNHLNSDDQLKCQSKHYVENGGLFTPKFLQNLIEQQIDLEKSGYVTVQSIEMKDTSMEEVAIYRKTLQEHYKMWEESAHAAFTRDLSTLTAQRSALNFEPYMRSIPMKDFIAIMLDEAKKLAQGSETYSPTVNMLHREMGKKVYARYKVLRKQRTGVLDKILDIHQKYCEDYAATHGALDVLPSKEVFVNPRQQWQWAHHQLCSTGATISMDHQEWVPTILQAIGKFLYHIVMHDLTVNVNSLRTNSKHKNYLPAFYTIFRTQGRVVKEEVKPHPILSRLYRASVPETLTFPTYEIPMRCPPIPWTSTQVGGYLVSPCDVVRLPSYGSSQKRKMAEAEPSQLYPSFDALNQLAAMPWKVNRKILDVILEVFNKGGSAKLDVPETPSSLPVPPVATIDMDKCQKYQIYRQKLQYRRKKAEMYSLWCDCLYRLSLANHFRDDIFWLPHNMDFRGRVYPVPPHLNHLGSDLARSMLVFAEARPLGPNGLDWLKLHLINLTGLKKRDTVSDRLKYANEIIDVILDSADKPLTGQMWWADSDEPWQTLACCMEIAEAIRSPDFQKFCSHFPIHQDGSCNGLQHYAALGRDSAGAYSVNLTHSEVPQDVYSAVVNLVEKQRSIDAKHNFEIAKVLEGFVNRKVIKQTVMTTVYGVTKFGARLQIARQLKDIDDFPKDSVWAASSYLTGRTFDSLRTMFTSTRAIQDWFTECARLISAVGGQHVEWVTPLGLPIVQPYVRYKKLSTSSVYDPYSVDKYEKPNVMKQKNAFPPNFIHSLDSSHMMLTSMHCERAGITFVSVHDCYWTHPSTVHIMNKICRDQFVALHSEPILENLSLFLSEKYSYDAKEFSGDGSVVDLTKRKLNRVLRQLPKTGNFDIKQVLDSLYFFS